MTKKPPRPDKPPDLWVLLAAWGPCGYVPVAPGTAGTLGAIPLYLALSRLPPAGYVLATAALTALAIAAAARAGVYWQVVDASPIVIDEVVGYLVTMAVLPRSWPWAAAGFFLFRVFDVVKPWPARWFDREVKNGFGVVIDDVFAGVWALAVLLAARLALQAALGCGGAGWWCAELVR